jgi:F0F1-type ATP synthase delta subunit
MNKVSRRSLASYAVDQIMAGRPATQIAKQLAASLASDGKTGEMEFLIGDINWELERRGELAIAKVTSATPLSRELAKELADQLRGATKSKQVLLDENIDKSVIGGMRIETSAKVWDATVSRKLSKLREAF